MDIKTRIVNILLIVAIILGSLSFIGPLKTITVTATVSIESDPTTDGIIIWAGGGITNDRNAEYLRESTSAGGSTRYMSYIEWDISAIPDSATITNVGFNVYGDGFSSPATTNFGNLQGMTIQPSAQPDDVTGWTALYNEIWGGGTLYKALAHNSFTDNAYINVNDTGGTAWDISPKAELEDQLASDWFAMALAVGAGNLGYYALMDSENNTEGHIFPTLWVEYQITTPIISNPSPSDVSTEIELTPTLCVDINYSNWSGYTSYAIIIESDYIETPVLDMPILVRINQTVSQYCNGGDGLQFWDYGNNTQFAHDVAENWSTTGINYVWVKVEHINSTVDTVFWIRYNNTDWANSADPAGVWSNGYVLVYHMDGTTGTVNDSTGNNLISTKKAVTSPEQGSGRIGFCQDFEVDDTEWAEALGTEDHILFNTTENTIEYWAKPETHANYGTISKNQDIINTNSWASYFMTGGPGGVQGQYESYILSDGVGTGNHSVYTNGTWGAGGSAAANYLSPLGTGGIGYWTKIIVTHENYTNGLGGNVNFGMGFGRNTNGVPGDRFQFFDGLIDEVKISNIRRNSTWINVSYHNENDTITNGPFLRWDTMQNIGDIGAGASVTVYWLWYNLSNGTFYNVSKMTIGANGTYCNDTFAVLGNLEPCTEYWWGILIMDSNGNYSEDFFSFTTFCVEPPTNLACGRINETALNLTWTELPANGGTSYTVIRYAEGNTPPSFTGGTLLYNATGEAVNLTGLEEATCYAISVWTNWLAPNGSWHLSLNKVTTICCTEGGDFTVMFRYENTSTDGQNNPINLTIFPYSTHRILVKYINGLERIYYVTNTSTNPTYIAAEYDVLYVEVWWNYSVNTSVEFNTTNSYYRRLTPYAAWNDSGNATLDFYFIVDRPVYGDYRQYHPNETILETNFEDNLVRYIYSFLDFSGEFISVYPYDVYSSVYSFNSTKDLIIHEDYWDSAQKTYPILLFGKAYGQSIYRISTSNEVRLGLCPTNRILEETLQIKKENLSLSLKNAAITYNWATGATGIWLYYHDIDIITTAIYLSVYMNNVTSTPIHYINKTGVSEWNFTGGFLATLNKSYVYIFKIVYYRNITIDINNLQYAVTTESRTLMPGVSSLLTGTYFNTLISNVIGRSPFYKPGEPAIAIPWSILVPLAVSLVIGLGLAYVDKTGIAVCLAFGSSLMAFTWIMSGIGGLYILGLAVILLGVTLMIARRQIK